MSRLVKPRQDQPCPGPYHQDPTPPRRLFMNLGSSSPSEDPKARKARTRGCWRGHTVEGITKAAPQRNILEEVAMTPGEPPGWSPTAGIGFNTVPPIEIQRSGALRGSVLGFWGIFPGVLWGSGGSLVMLNSFTGMDSGVFYFDSWG